jgi:hypothetical protein
MQSEYNDGAVCRSGSAKQPVFDRHEQQCGKTYLRDAKLNRERLRGSQSDAEKQLAWLLQVNE